MSENVKFIHFSTNESAEATQLESGDIAFNAQSSYIETHGVKYGQLLWNELPESEIPEGLVARYSAYGKSNSDSDRDILRDLTGNGHDIQLYNFGWSGMSGYGGYEPMNAWGSNHTDMFPIITLKEDEISVRCVNSQTERANLLYFRLQNNRNWNGNDIPIIAGEYGVRIFTSESTNNIISLSPFEEGLLGKELIQQCIDDGTSVLYAGPTTSIPKNGIFTMKTKPIYKGALVSDGVDDYGICENFPILTKEKGYTVVAVRKWLRSKDGDSFVSNEKGSSNTGAFSVEYFYGNNYNTYSWGGFSTVSENYTEDCVYQTSDKYNGKAIAEGSVQQSTDNLCLFTKRSGFGISSKIALYALEIYDRDLTDDEIIEVKERMISEYESETGLKYEEV